MRQRGNARTLPLGEIGAHFEDEVAIGQALERGEFGQYIRRHAAGTRSQLEHVTAGVLQHGGALPSKATRKQARDLRRRDEVAIAAELGGAGAVVPETGRVQGQAHPRIETDDAAALEHEGADVFDDSIGMRAFVGVEQRQGCDGCGRSHRVQA